MAWAPDYITLAQAKAWLRIGDTVDDDEIEEQIASVSRRIDRACGRQFGILDAIDEWFYTLTWDRHQDRWITEIDDVATQAGMIVKVDGVVTTDYTLEPRQAVAKGTVWTRLVLGEGASGTDARDGLGLTALFGWPAFPAPVTGASKLQLSRFMARRDSPFGIAGSPDSGSEMRLLARLDPDVNLMLDCVRRRAWVR